MTTLIDATQTTTVFVNTATPVFITPNGVASVSTGPAVQITGGDSVLTSLTVAGTVVNDAESASGASAIASFDQGARIFVTQTGTVTALGVQATGIFALDGGQDITINGSVYAYDAALFLQGGAVADRITIGQTGTVIGGSGRRVDGDFDHAAIWAASDSTAGTVIVNHGTIFAEFDVDTGNQIAIVNTVVSNVVPGPDPFTNTSAVLDFTNTGVVTGDVLALAGMDVIQNAGLIDGDVMMGDDNDFFAGQGGQVTGIVDGGDGNDTVIGGYGDDELADDDGNDRHFGLDGDDFIYTGIGSDSVFGGGGDDEILGGSSGDLLFGGSGDDIIDGESGTDRIDGDSGDDTIDGGSASDTIDGGSGDDDIRGGDQGDLISGQSGDDFLRGENDNDSIGGGSGADTISGGTGNDSVDAGSGDDRIFGGSGNDTLRGTLGDDFLNGGLGDDSMSGGSNDDILDGDAGQDTMSGGRGMDVFDFNEISDSASGSATRDTITDFEAGVDLIDLSDISSSLTFVTSFTGVAGQVRYNDAVGRLYIDSDGDMGSDFQVDLGAGAGLTADDLIL